MINFRLHEVILYVQDMGRQVSFYRDFLRLPVLFPADLSNVEELDWVTFDTGACKLALHSGGKCDFGFDAPKFVLSVDDLEKWHSRLSSVAVNVDKIRTPAPGIHVFDAMDFEGNRFSIESVQ
ncbi:VOC family protein [Thalassoglobus sp.]|uniref:VOC family protein n=1 Tax=Thalassoglobus sp. TaxID=2795869 RepID=UPI003AA85AFB